MLLGAMSAIDNPTEAEQQIPAETSPQIAAQAKVIIPACEIDAIIRKRVYGSVALGLAPIPLLDLIGLYAIQVDLVRALANKYGVPFKADMPSRLMSV